jgi:hypothetical protein
VVHRDLVRSRINIGPLRLHIRQAQEFNLTRTTNFGTQACVIGAWELSLTVASLFSLNR